MGKVQELQNVSLATTYEIDDTFDSEKFIKMRLRVCHDGKNPNSSNFEVDNMEKSKDSIQNIPILANVIFDENDEPQFSGHDMELEKSKANPDEYKVIFKETPIGLIPQNCNHTIEDFNGKNYVFVDGYIWRNYSNYAEDIINRDGESKLSMEIVVDAYSYDSKKKCYNITDYRYTGITFLNKDFGTGMEDALATTGTFAEDNSKEKFIIIMEELKDTLTQYNINSKIKEETEKGGKEIVDKKLELLAKFNLTVEQLNFNIEEISIEDLEAKLTDIKEKFALSHNQLESEIKSELRKATHIETDWYGDPYECQDFYLRDIKDNIAIVIDSNWEDCYGIPFTISGDSVTLDYANKVEYISDWRPKIAGDSSLEFEIKVTEKFKEISLKKYNEVTEKFNTLETEHNTSKTTLVETETKLAGIESDFAKLKEDNDSLVSEVESLKEFKLAKETLEKEEVFAKFEGLTDEDIADIKANISDYSVEVLEEKLFSIWGKKKMELETGKKFSKKELKTDKKDKLVFSLVDEGKDLNAPIYADIVNKYKK